MKYFQLFGVGSGDLVVEMLVDKETALKWFNDANHVFILNRVSMSCTDDGTDLRVLKAVFEPGNGLAVVCEQGEHDASL